MARRYATSIDLLGFAVLNAMLDPVSSDPSGLGTGQKGRVWFNTTTGKLMYWDGTTAIDATARANHTGTQLASTISNLAATVQAYRLDQFAAPTSPVSLGSQRITNQADPTSAQDSATKNYVDTQLAGVLNGLALKGSVRVATSTNTSLSSPGATVDGVTMSSGDVILLMGQTTASQNGPWVWTGSAAALTRPTNYPAAGTATPGSFWDVREGTSADLFALLTTDGAVTIDTTSTAFVIRGNPGATYTAGNGITLPANAITVNPASGGGISVAAGGVSVDSTVGRKVTGSIPASTSGIFSVSGSTVTINHGLNNTAPLFVIRPGSTPVSGYTQGQQVELDNVVSDANNLVVTLPAAPAANNWVITVIG